MELRLVVATHCNANCYFCLNEYIGTKSSKFSMYPIHYEKIMIIAQELGINDCTITGGEPTLRKDLINITNSIRKHSNRVSMVSNGYLLDQQLDALSNIDELHISLHSMNSNEWSRITKVKDGLDQVLKNIPLVRKSFPKLRIKLNTVAEPQNSSIEQIKKYLDFAYSNQCELNLFQEGYFSFLKEMGADIRSLPKKSPWWDLDYFNPTLISTTNRKQILDVQGVKIALTLTSTDAPSWDSCWISPLASGFVDVRHKTPLIDFMNALESNDQQYIQDGLKSLLEESILETQYQSGNIHQNEYLTQKLSIIETRQNKFKIAVPQPVSNLFRAI